MKLHPAVSSILWFLMVMTLGLFIVAGSVVWSGIRNRPGDFVAQLKVMTPADAEQTLKERLENYSKQADDLQKLASILIGLGTIYTIALGLSSYAAVQMNLQLVEKHLSDTQLFIQDRKALLDQQRERADKSLETLEAVLVAGQRLLEDSRLKWQKIQGEIEDAKLYVIRICAGSASLALALQGNYLGDAAEAIKKLKEIRKNKPTDDLVNRYLGRLHKALRQFDKAADVMSAYIEKMEQAGEPDDTVMADAFFNRACYQSLQYPSADATLKVKLQAGITADLEKSIYSDITYKTAAGLDPDFGPVKEEPWFKQLLSNRGS